MHTHTQNLAASLATISKDIEVADGVRAHTHTHIYIHTRQNLAASLATISKDLEVADGVLEQLRKRGLADRCVCVCVCVCVCAS